VSTEVILLIILFFEMLSLDIANFLYCSGLFASVDCVFIFWMVHVRNIIVLEVSLKFCTEYVGSSKLEICYCNKCVYVTQSKWVRSVVDTCLIFGTLQLCPLVRDSMSYSL
jgi:hypothetical protein